MHYEQVTSVRHRFDWGQVAQLTPYTLWERSNALTFRRRITSTDSTNTKSKIRVRAANTPSHSTGLQMLSVTKPSPRGHQGSAQKGKNKMMMIMMMTTCKVKKPAERNLNGFGVQTQTTAVKQNGVQLVHNDKCPCVLATNYVWILHDIICEGLTWWRLGWWRCGETYFAVCVHVCRCLYAKSACVWDVW